MTARKSMTTAALVLTLALLSVPLRWLSLMSLFCCLVVLLTTNIERGTPGRRLSWMLLWLAAGATLVGLTRFVYLDAVPGIVQGGEQAVMQRAVSHLREILRVQDSLRTQAINDADGDGVGSAALIGELSGATPVRHGRLVHAPLNKRFQSTVDTKIGPAAVIDGYAFIVCLKTEAGTYSGLPGTAFDEESSERHFIAYAWPLDASRASFAIDAEDRILTRTNDRPELPVYAGQLHPPDCAVVPTAAARDGWAPWRGKKPRTSTPGARAAGEQYDAG